MEPVDVVKQAVEVIEKAKVPGDLRALAFGKVLDMLASTTSDQPSPGRDEDRANSGHDRVNSDFISTIAAKMDIPSTLGDRIFGEHKGELIFSGDVSALGGTKSEKVHTLAVLFLAGRRWAGLDAGGTTSDEVLRAEVDRHGLLDVSNYGKHISSLKPFVTITGSGKKATYKIKFDGLEKAKQVGRALAGVE
jgi:hypothetical protein